MKLAKNDRARLSSDTWNLSAVSWKEVSDLIMSFLRSLSSPVAISSYIGTVGGILLVATAAYSDSSGEITLQIPMPPEIVRTIVNLADVEEGASFEELLAVGRVEKRTENVNIFFVYDQNTHKAHLNSLIEEQILPLLTAAGNTSRLVFERVFSLYKANAILVMDDSSSSGLARIGEDALFNWFGESAEEFAVIKTFEADVSGCFRFNSAPNGEIKKSLGFVSTLLSRSEQETCIAKNLLFSLGLQGPADGPSARNPTYSPRETGLLDDMALELLYRNGVAPHMTLDEAFKVSPSK